MRHHQGSARLLVSDAIEAIRDGDLGKAALYMGDAGKEYKTAASLDSVHGVKEKGYRLLLKSGRAESLSIGLKLVNDERRGRRDMLIEGRGAREMFAEEMKLAKALIERIRK
ncbi:MAG: hypothetical protein KGH74_02630 [Candidatus Micrarchaeota archaeon]|nr:hypothetical protein [Candidatus Micrarchaeota archaeon]MDE1824173.1 hypothetical protein [Candidatus Micrarchaeota archaeon]